MTPMNPITLYGIPNCDTVKKARAWLAEHHVDAQFHDFKKHGVPAEAMARWIGQVGWEPLLNRKGTTWRKLASEQQVQAAAEQGAVALMQSQPSVIKRPVVDWGHCVTVGFDAVLWQKLASR